MSKQNYGLPPKDPALLELIRLRAERDALAAQLATATQVVTIVQGERDALAALLPGVHYMDPPDGGDVPLDEQMRRMAADAARYRWLRGDVPESSSRWSRWRIEHWASPGPTWSDVRSNDLDAAIDAELAKDKP